MQQLRLFAVKFALRASKVGLSPVKFALRASEIVLRTVKSGCAGFYSVVIGLSVVHDPHITH